MDLYDAIRQTGACRYYKTDPVPDEVLARIFDAARFGPQGGNRQPNRYIVVRDRALKEQLGEWYLARWEAVMQGYYAKAAGPDGQLPPMLQGADNMARHFADIPVIVVLCAVFPSLLRTDADLDRPGVVGGASVYPSMQNLLLAARAEGVGACVTTLLCADEPEVKKLLGIPDDLITCAHLTMGYPERPLPTKLSRGSLSEMVFADRYGAPMFD